jgi:engulfment/cell motility protein 1
MLSSYPSLASGPASFAYVFPLPCLNSDQVLETLLSRYEKLGPSSSPSSDHALPSDATLTSGPQTPFTPLLLSLPRIHSLATAFFLRIASESSALFPTDFPRLSLVVRSQIEHVLQNESRFVVARSSAEGGGVSGSAARRGMKCWLGIEEGFEEEYRSVKERLLKEAEERDDLLANPSIRNLRQTLYYESLAFVEHQRIECMLAGSWFVIGSPLKAYTRPPGRTTSNGWLFLRLSPNRGTTLGYLTTQFRLGTKPSWEELTERCEFLVSFSFLDFPSL